MSIKDYINKINHIREKELLTLLQVCHEIGISYNTWVRINFGPEEKIALKTKRKIRDFVDKWE